MIILVYYMHDLELGNIVNFEFKVRIEQLGFIGRRTYSIENWDFLM